MTRVGLLADVHGNLEALAAALGALEAQGVERLVCLGDLVGYNAESNECVALLAQLGAAAIAGNHDLIALGRMGFERCADKPAYALRRTRRELDAASRAYLAALPPHRVIEDEWVAIHGGVDDVGQYLYSPARVAENDARLAARFARARVCLFGHTHDAAVYAVARGVAAPLEARPGAPVRLDGPRGHRFFVNPGAVDGARKPSGVRCAEFAVLDTARRTVTLLRAPYDDARAERRAAAGGYRMTELDAWRYAAARLLRRARDYAARRARAAVGLGRGEEAAR